MPLEKLHVCQFCGKATKSYNRVPSFRLGNQMFEQVACDACKDRILSEINKYWEDEQYQGPHCCRKCGCACDGSEKPVMTQRSMKQDGSWTLVPICERCFCGFDECCRRAKGGVQDGI